jgi:hypothetical protein
VAIDTDFKADSTAAAGAADGMTGPVIDDRPDDRGVGVSVRRSAASAAAAQTGPHAFRLRLSKANGHKCGRCWKLTAPPPPAPPLCARCAPLVEAFTSSQAQR